MASQTRFGGALSRPKKPKLSSSQQRFLSMTPEQKRYVVGQSVQMDQGKLTGAIQRRMQAYKAPRTQTSGSGRFQSTSTNKSQSRAYKQADEQVNSITRRINKAKKARF